MTTLRDLFLEADTLGVAPPPTDDLVQDGRSRLRRKRQRRALGVAALVAATVCATVVLVGHRGSGRSDSIAPEPARRFTIGELQRAAAAIFRGVPGQPDPRMIAYAEIPAVTDHLVIAASASISRDQLQGLTDVPVTPADIDPDVAHAVASRPPGPGLVRPFRVARAHGTVAYVDGQLLDAVTGKSAFTSSKAALAWQRRSEAQNWQRRLIPVASKDGSRILGSFPIARTHGRVMQESNATVTGRLLFAGGPVDTPRPLRRGTVTLAGRSGTYRAPVAPDGTFQVQVIRSGTYTVTATSPDYTFNGREGKCSANSPVEVRPSRTAAVRVYCPIK